MFRITCWDRLKVLQQLKRSALQCHRPFCYPSSKEHILHSTSVTRTINRRMHSKISIGEQLEEIFNFKDTNLSNWIVESKVQALCNTYNILAKDDQKNLLHTLALQYATDHHGLCQLAKKLACIEPSNRRQVIVGERALKNALTPTYQWLFVLMGRLEHGVKFLVDLRADVLELMSEVSNPEETIVIQQLNFTLRDLLLLWFSVGFLHLERITWQSSCAMLEKVSNYEAIHPIRNWTDLKQRVGPFRRCYIFTHPSMPGEPLVVLHTALCDIIPSSVKGIVEAEKRILDGRMEPSSFLQEDKNKIQAAIFYSISSTQKGLQGIELGNYLIKEVVGEILQEFPMIDQLSSLSPIPNFRLWLLKRIKQDTSEIFTRDERNAIEYILKSKDLYENLKKVLNNSLWTNDTELSEVLKVPLLRSCAWYLYKEKRRNYALNAVANFHLRNGAVMWRINWMADPSPRGANNSCGIMVNYRYFLSDTETNSRNYIERNMIKASVNITDLVTQAEKLIGT